LETYRSIEDVHPIDGSVLTVGTFDGLHRGHLAVIDRVVEHAKMQNVPSVVLTFHPHPQHILAKAGTPKQEVIVTLEKKLDLIGNAGIDIAMVFNFDHGLSRVTARDFLHDIIVGRFHPSEIVIGYDHHFGHDHQGDAEFLRNQSSAYGYSVDVVDEVNASDSTISSSNIRQLIKNGHCEAGARLLGRPYEISGTVVKGIQRGKRLTYPTANLKPDEKNQLIPKHGVYIVSSTIDNQEYFGMCNVGIRPTFEEKSVTIEAHFFDMEVDNLYHRKLALRFYHWIRDERKFEDASELRAQIDRDKRRSCHYLKSKKKIS
jgi:riboflavin kinase/FMN adenylyltransferase